MILSRSSGANVVISFCKASSLSSMIISLSYSRGWTCKRRGRSAAAKHRAAPLAWDGRIIHYGKSIKQSIKSIFLRIYFIFID